MLYTWNLNNTVNKLYFSKKKKKNEFKAPRIELIT